MSNTIYAPEILSLNDLHYAPDDTLYKNLRLLSEERTRVVASDADPYYWDVEISYLQRELEHRDRAREMHDVYLKSNANVSHR